MTVDHDVLAAAIFLVVVYAFARFHLWSWLWRRAWRFLWPPRGRKKYRSFWETVKKPERSVARRPAIPERVRNEVWRRDQGRCVDCGSRYHLEYDHIIPFSRGGSSTTRNLELRCEPCNRSKGAKI